MNIFKILEREKLEYDAKPFELIIDGNLVEVFEIKNAKIDNIIKRAKEGELIPLFILNPLIDYLTKLVGKGKDEVTVLVFEKAGSTTNVYGEKKIKRMIRLGHEEFKEFIKEYEGYRELFGLVRGEVEIAVGEKSLEKEVFGGEEDNFNLSIGDAIYIRAGGSLYGWKLKKIKGYEDPIKSLALAKKLFKRVGGIIVKGKYFPNPDAIINENYMEKHKEGKEYRLKKLRKLRNMLIYYMNFKGKVLEFINKKRERYGKKEVIVCNEKDKELIKNKLRKNVDYYIRENCILTKLNTLLLLKKGEVILGKEEEGYIVKDKFERGDTLVEGEVREERFIVKIYEYSKKQEFLMIMEHYLLIKSKNIMVAL